MIEKLLSLEDRQKRVKAFLEDEYRNYRLKELIHCYENMVPISYHIDKKSGECIINYKSEDELKIKKIKQILSEYETRAYPDLIKFNENQ